MGYEDIKGIFELVGLDINNQCTKYFLISIMVCLILLPFKNIFAPIPYLTATHI